MLILLLVKFHSQFYHGSRWYHHWYADSCCIILDDHINCSGDILCHSVPTFWQVAQCWPQWAPDQLGAISQHYPVWLYPKFDLLFRFPCIHFSLSTYAPPSFDWEGWMGAKSGSGHDLVVLWEWRPDGEMRLQGGQIQYSRFPLISSDFLNNLAVAFCLFFCGDVIPKDVQVCWLVSRLGSAMNLLHMPLGEILPRRCMLCALFSSKQSWLRVDFMTKIIFWPVSPALATAWSHLDHKFDLLYFTSVRSFISMWVKV